MPTRGKIIAAVCAAASAGVVLTGCNSDGDSASPPVVAPVVTTSAASAEPFADLTAKDVLKHAEQSMRDAGALTYEMTGSDDDGTAMHIKASITQTGKCALAADMDGDKVQLIATGGAYTYMKGDRAFWTDNADAKTARLIGRKWVKIPASEYDDGDLKAMCDLNGLMDSLSEGDDDADTTIVKGTPTTVDGKPVMPLVQTDSDGKTTIFVTTGDTPYVLRADQQDADPPEVILFSDFGKQPNVTAPPSSQTIDPKDFGSGPGGLHV